jgi:hypothetical protein
MWIRIRNTGSKDDLFVYLFDTLLSSLTVCLMCITVGFFLRLAHFSRLPSPAPEQLSVGLTQGLHRDVVYLG